MKINGKWHRSIDIISENPTVIQIIDQRALPHNLLFEKLTTVEEVFTAIREMHLRGAPLIGAVAAFGVHFAIIQSENSWEKFLELTEYIKSSRPTAVNLEWAVNRQIKALEKCDSQEERIQKSLEIAKLITDEDAEICKNIGIHTLPIIEKISQEKNGEPVNILTHCNAGWLATVDYGTATSGMYQAHEKGIDIHVYVDETRPRNQGARLTAWELAQHGIPHTVIVDNVGGHLMQHKMVDMVIVGTDRTTRSGDVANKIGTYLKALAAHDNNIPFFVALPSTTIDWEIRDGIKEIPIEKRSENEVKYIQGKNEKGEVEQVLLCPENSPAVNYAFDVTPAKYVSKLITERGICEASESGLVDLFPEKK